MRVSEKGSTQTVSDEEQHVRHLIEQVLFTAQEINNTLHRLHGTADTMAKEQQKTEDVLFRQEENAYCKDTVDGQQ